MWVKTWRVQVPNKFKEYMERAEALSAGWTVKNRAARPPVPSLDPTVVEPPGKRVNVEGPPHPLN